MVYPLWLLGVGRGSAGRGSTGVLGGNRTSGRGWTRLYRALQFSQPSVPYVGIWFRGNVIAGSLQAADDLDAADYFPLDALPENLAFPTDNLVLEQLRQES